VIGKSEKQDAESRTQQAGRRKAWAHTSERKTYCFAVHEAAMRDAGCTMTKVPNREKRLAKKATVQKKIIRVSAGLVVWTPVSDKQ
jgi:hypothetical protein